MTRSSYGEVKVSSGNSGATLGITVFGACGVELVWTHVVMSTCLLNVWLYMYAHVCKSTSTMCNAGLSMCVAVATPCMGHVSIAV